MITKNRAARPDYFAAKPDLIGRLRAITRERESFALDPKLRALVEIRISQLNGCAYCTDLHSQEARAMGERQQRLDTLPVWRESPFFAPNEKAALAWAEGMTLIASAPTGDAAYGVLRDFFSENEVVELSLCAALANFWNRMAATFRMMPAAVVNCSDA